MIIFYIIAGAFVAILFAGTVCTVSHVGEKENICKYDYTEE